MNNTEHVTLGRRRRAWLQQQVRGYSLSNFADIIGVNSSTVGSWLSRASIPAEGVIKVALGMNIDPVEALVDTCYLPWRWYPKEVPDLRRARTEDLVEELQERLPQELGDTVATIVNSHITPPE